MFLCSSFPFAFRALDYYCPVCPCCTNHSIYLLRLADFTLFLRYFYHFSLMSPGERCMWIIDRRYKVLCHIQVSNRYHSHYYALATIRNFLLIQNMLKVSKYCSPNRLQIYLYLNMEIYKYIKIGKYLIIKTLKYLHIILFYCIFVFG